MTNKIFTTLAASCMLEDEALVDEYVMNRKQQIIREHEQNVFPIKKPGEKGGDPCKWLTKMTPKNRNHDGKLRANTREELEEKILCYYLKIESSEKVTVREILLKAVDNTTETGLRTVQRFDKHLGSLASLPLSQLSERTIRAALDTVVASSNISKRVHKHNNCPK